MKQQGRKPQKTVSQSSANVTKASQMADRLECPVCMNSYVSTPSAPLAPMLFTGCGHDVCFSCSKKLISCPICRTAGQQATRHHHYERLVVSKGCSSAIGKTRETVLEHFGGMPKLMAAYGLKISQIKEADDVIKSLIADDTFKVKPMAPAAGGGSATSADTTNRKRPRFELEGLGLDAADSVEFLSNDDNLAPPAEIYFASAAVTTYHTPTAQAIQRVVAAGHLLVLRESVGNPGWLVGKDEASSRTFFVRSGVSLCPALIRVFEVLQSVTFSNGAVFAAGRVVSGFVYNGTLHCARQLTATLVITQALGEVPVSYGGPHVGIYSPTVDNLVFRTHPDPESNCRQDVRTDAFLVAVASVTVRPGTTGAAHATYVRVIESSGEGSWVALRSKFDGTQCLKQLADVEIPSIPCLSIAFEASRAVEKVANASAAAIAALRSRTALQMARIVDQHSENQRRRLEAEQKAKKDAEDEETARRNAARKSQGKCRHCNNQYSTRCKNSCCKRCCGSIQSGGCGFH